MILKIQFFDSYSLMPIELNNFFFLKKNINYLFSNKQTKERVHFTNTTFKNIQCIDSFAQQCHKPFCWKTKTKHQNFKNKKTKKKLDWYQNQFGATMSSSICSSPFSSTIDYEKQTNKLINETTNFSAIRCISSRHHRRFDTIARQQRKDHATLSPSLCVQLFFRK